MSKSNAGEIICEGNIAGRGFSRLEILDGRIAQVETTGPRKDGAEFLTPGFIDIQLNGFNGVDFSAEDLTIEQACSVVEPLRCTGTVRFCPTLVTNSREALSRNLTVLEQAREQDRNFARAVPCYHLEGPYFRPGVARGVHRTSFMRDPDWQEFSELQDAAHGHIGIITLDPATRGSVDFIRHTSTSGVVVGIAHTEANTSEIYAAISAGARLSTHLGNGCGPLLPRHQNPIWPQLVRDELAVSIICDGFHLPTEVVQAFVRICGKDRLILITDATHVAGLPPGIHRLVGEEIELLPSGKVVRADRGSLAGSVLTMDRAVSSFIRLGRVSLRTALRAASHNPARLLGLTDVCTELKAGEPAEIVQVQFERNDLKVKKVIVPKSAH